ncbi:hypothetical protein A1Q1_03213 [Trichosporon asahii var. asahii CBS 2479]|uniref:Uncharacterized protein n=1 Tax=Trichosporon asahii var. asahii (strain ATCC 90039 / CBS 2479 / JCM 2466 / KCTC 7840 / NBRC 103889/ NCYC 2677 / UAMH 7654) TaxID=1186058 RepID=J6EYI3_TRIAS|nr:hypothetical protein A1Q1_03213 [Trichosporon asahii var. asahii CBS 2479]EJT47907.1 hypothetical protein A1Q1_03213 [Trichosporon asahii var. asahii CBS 2479]
MYERVVVAGLLPVSAALFTPSEAQDPSLQPPLPFIAADLDVVIASVHLSAQQPLSHTLALAAYVPKPSLPPQLITDADAELPWIVSAPI